MNAPKTYTSRPWKVGDRFTAQLIAGPPKRNGQRALRIDWAPRLPDNLTEEELNDYRQGRNAAFAALGLQPLVIEM